MRFPAYGLFLVLSSIFPLFAILNSPSDPQNAFILGYSLERILLGIGLISIIGSLLLLTLKLIRRPGHSIRLWKRFFTQKESGHSFIWLTLTVFFACWIALFMPAYRLSGKLTGYVTGLFPFLIWLAVVSAITMLVLIYERGRKTLASVIITNKSTVNAAMIVFTLMALTGILIFANGIGIRQPEDYWYGAGVPVLGLQILISLTAGVILLQMESRSNLKFDLIICAILWFVTAWLWIREPLSTNYFFPDTAKNDIYPYSDSAVFDLGSQFALIGQGLFNGRYFDRALYSAFLTFLHVIAGQDIHRLMNIQAVVFAVFPVIVYLLGRELHSRALGVSTALLIAMRGANAIVVSKWVDTASPKMMLTDFPTAIGVAAFMLFAIKWVREPQKVHHAVWSGGMLGLTIMLRTHVLLLLPTSLLLFFILFRHRLKYAMAGSFLLIIGMLTATLPWDIRNYLNGTPLFYTYYSRIELILQERYGITQDIYSPSYATIPLVIQQEARVPFPLRASAKQAVIYNARDNTCTAIVCSVANHFIHNIITSTIFLPTSFALDDLWNVVKLKEAFWKNDWSDARLSLATTAFLFTNLFVISLGLGTIWKRSKAGLSLTIFMFLAYQMTNALGLTSGGRYIVPIDWVVCILFMSGL